MAIKESYFALSPLKRLLLVALLLLIFITLLSAAVRGYLAQRSFLQREAELIQQARQAEARAFDAENRARDAAAQIARLDGLIEEANESAALSEIAYINAQAGTIRARREYAVIRQNPIDRSAPVPSGAELCARLKAAGFPCA